MQILQNLQTIKALFIILPHALERQFWLDLPTRIVNTVAHLNNVKLCINNQPEMSKIGLNIMSFLYLG